jgi:hypothetical protein
MQAIFPVSWHTISSSNNTLFVAITNGFNSPPVWYGIYQITIPSGSYDIDQMVSMLQVLLNAATAQDFQAVPWTLTSTTDGRLSLAFGDPESTTTYLFQVLSREEVLNPSLFYSDDNPPLRLPNMDSFKNQLANTTLGFSGNNLQNSGPGEALVAPGLFNTLGTQYVCIHSNMQQLSSQGPGLGDNDVVGMIPVMGNYGSLNVYECPGTDIGVFSVAGMTLQSLNFYLTNDSGQRMDLHGGTVALSFMIYDHP